MHKVNKRRRPRKKRKQKKLRPRVARRKSNNSRIQPYGPNDGPPAPKPRKKEPKLKQPRKSRSRLRTRYVPVSYVVYNAKTGAIRESLKANMVYDQMNDRNVAPCNMNRVTTERFTGVYRKCRFDGPTGPIYDVYLCNYPAGPWINFTATMYVWNIYLNHLRWTKVATSNEADLLTAFAEFDDTMAMFNKNMLRRQSYGSVKWGWMPLISDISAANDAAHKVKASLLQGNRRTQRYNATHTIRKNSVDLQAWGGVFYHEWDVKVKHEGHITYENDVLAFYDYMGFHPSLKIAWDLVPLSFAIDYVLPIGEMLSAITPTKGWVKSANFTGWRIVTARVREVCKVPPKGYNNCIMECDTPFTTYVYRDYLNGVALEQKTFSKEIQALKMPSWSQAFDLAYLASAFHSSSKKLLKAIG